MAESPPFYPFKVTSRSLAPTRANRLRVSWFLLGLIAGVGVMMTFSSGMAPRITPEEIAEEEAKDEALTAIVARETPAEKPAPEKKEETPKQAPAAASKPEAVYPLTLTLTVENGDTLMDMLTDNGVSMEEAHNLISAIGKAYNLRRLNIGQTITVNLDKNAEGKPVIKSVMLPISPTSSLEMVRTQDDKFESKKLQAPVERKTKKISAAIDSSFYETGIEQGLSPALLAELIAAYSYDVDFQRDIQRGDKLTVLYERMVTKEGIQAGYGNVLYAELGIGGKPLKIYRYVDKSGRADYYNAKGESVRKALLRTPINGAKITSGFGVRNHPLLGYSRMHRGVDFGAPTGTPIYAAGDGKVDFLGKRGGYGNYLRLQHSNKYATAYAHVSRFAKGINMGSKVKQGQIIAYVGSTGIATGPHLHYEVLVGGDQVNPAKIKFKTGNVLGGKELAAFRKHIADIEAQLADPDRKMDVAMNAPESGKNY